MCYTLTLCLDCWNFDAPSCYNICIKVNLLWGPRHVLVL
uniref:Uncharacterized protein n=1 Tax=Anguilla anguilla TaxID=7936 RepID=A0A0E9UD45_ANGAN